MYIELDMQIVEGFMGWITHACHQRPTAQRKAMALSIINNSLRPLITDLERADERSDYAIMLTLPAVHHKLLGQWIETSATAYTWNVLVSSDSKAQQVRRAFFPADAATTFMAVGGAVFRLRNGHEDDSGQTADIVQFIQLDEERDYNKMLGLCTTGKYVKGFSQVLLGHKIKEWNLIEDDAKGRDAQARAVGDAVFVS
jgi:hypothetical protein